MNNQQNPYARELGTELVVLHSTPTRDRPLISGVLISAATAAFILLATVAHRQQSVTRNPRPQLPDAVDEPWFAPEALEGFPMEALRPLLLGPHAPNLNRLYTGWILATHGYGASWIEQHLDLPTEAAHLLVDAARR